MLLVLAGTAIRPHGEHTDSSRSPSIDRSTVGTYVLQSKSLLPRIYMYIP